MLSCPNALVLLAGKKRRAEIAQLDEIPTQNGKGGPLLGAASKVQRALLTSAVPPIQIGCRLHYLSLNMQIHVRMDNLFMSWFSRYPYSLVSSGKSGLPKLQLAPCIGQAERVKDTNFTCGGGAL